MSDSSNMSMSMPMGTFHWSAFGDALWFNSWLPTSEAGYIGACIGLFLISVLSRGILAIEIYYVAWRSRDCTTVQHTPLQKAQSESKPSDAVGETTAVYRMDSISSASAISAPTYPPPMGLPAIPSFSWTTDPMRSFLTALASFVNYLLMLVVMTGNGGYFIVVIVGIFVGELAFGRFRSLGGFRVDEHIH